MSRTTVLEHVSEMQSISEHDQKLEVSDTRKLPKAISDTYKK